MDPAPSPAPSSFPNARDVDDIGRVLIALWKYPPDSSPQEIVRQYVTPSLDQFRKNVPGNTIDIEGLPKLEVAPRAPIRLGGGGVVLSCSNKVLPSLRYALKVPRPSLLEDFQKGAEEYQRYQAEYLQHAPLSHRNVARVFGGGPLTVIHPSGIKIVLIAILMEWVEGALPLESYLHDTRLHYSEIIDLFSQSFEGLYHIHSKNLIHWDLKSDNLLVAADQTIKITDLGNSRRTDDPNRILTALSTHANLPPGLIKATAPMSPDHSERRTPITLPDLSWDCPWLDLWMLAREWNRHLGADPVPLARVPGPRTRSSASRLLDRDRSCFPEEDDDAQFSLGYLRLILERLLAAEAPSAQSYYGDARQVVRDVANLTPEFGAAQNLSELQAIPQRVMRLPHTGNAPYTPRVGRLFNSNLVQSLSRHLQLGTLAHVYPGATHRRSEHVVGVTATAAQFVRALYADRTDPFWRISVEGRDVNALLLAAMLHDAGHIAFGHFLEEMAGLFRNRMHEDYIQHILDPSRSDLAAKPLRFQESVRRRRDELLRLVREDWVTEGESAEGFLAYVGEILRPVTRSEAIFEPVARRDPGMSRDLKLQILHSILDSAIDADKLDYLLRDSYHCGVKYGFGVDQERFFQSLTTVSSLPGVDAVQREGDVLSPRKAQACVAITSKGILPVESLLISRYQMFNSVYWHHTARAETAMLQFLVQEFIKRGQDENGMIARLEELIESFRELTDRQALTWLKQKLGAPKKKGTLLGSICDGLLGEDRGALYWPAFELRYEQGSWKNDKYTTRAKSACLTLMKISDAQNEAPSIGRYLELVSELRNGFSGLVVDKLKELGKVVTFGDGELLLDIPPAGSDQIDNIFVVADESVKPIQELSPIADAVRESFMLWARKVRVFLAPTAWSKCKASKVTRAEIADACWLALNSLEMHQNPQLSLFEEQS